MPREACSSQKRALRCTKPASERRGRNLKGFEPPESQGLNLALAVLQVPYSLDSGLLERLATRIGKEVVMESSRGFYMGDPNPRCSAPWVPMWAQPGHGIFPRFILASRDVRDAKAFSSFPLYYYQASTQVYHPAMPKLCSPRGLQHPSSQSIAYPSLSSHPAE